MSSILHVRILDVAHTGTIRRMTASDAHLLKVIVNVMSISAGDRQGCLTGWLGDEELTACSLVRL